MQTRVAVVAIVVEDPDQVERINQILHEYRSCVIGRMGIPYPRRGISLISVAVDAPQEVISALSGKIGRLREVSVKTAYSNVFSGEENESGEASETGTVSKTGKASETGTVSGTGTVSENGGEQ